jgi:hypothetical protein
MSEAKKRFPKMVSPAGTMVYPWLNKPDTKFKEEGEYRVKLRLNAEDGQALVDKLQPLYDEAIAAAEARFVANPKNKGKKVKLDPQDFYSMVRDDDGDETGEFEFNFKRTASGISKKTGNPWTITPDLFDAKGNKLASDARIFGGSVGKVAFEVIPYDTPKAQGIKLNLNAVQVTKLVSGERDATSHGFGNEAPDDDEGDTETPEGDGGDSKDDGSGDF